MLRGGTPPDHRADTVRLGRCRSVRGSRHRRAVRRILSGSPAANCAVRWTRALDGRACADRGTRHGVSPELNEAIGCLFAAICQMCRLSGGPSAADVVDAVPWGSRESVLLEAAATFAGRRLGPATFGVQRPGLDSALDGDLLARAQGIATGPTRSTRLAFANVTRATDTGGRSDPPVSRTPEE